MHEVKERKAVLMVSIDVWYNSVVKNLFVFRDVRYSFMGGNFSVLILFSVIEGEYRFFGTICFNGPIDIRFVLKINFNSL